MRTAFDRTMLWLTAAAVSGLMLLYAKHFNSLYPLFVAAVAGMLLWQIFGYWKAKSKDKSEERNALAQVAGVAVMFAGALCAWGLPDHYRAFAIFSGIALGNIVTARLGQKWELETQGQREGSPLPSQDETVWPPPPRMPDA